MKKILIIHIGSFIGTFFALFVLFTLEFIGKIPKKDPLFIEIGMTVLGFVFLISVAAMWIYAVKLVLHYWNEKTSIENLIFIASLLIGNILGAYLIFYAYRDRLKEKGATGTPLDN